jgi:hypothetical protein
MRNEHTTRIFAQKSTNPLFNTGSIFAENSSNPLFNTGSVVNKICQKREHEAEKENHSKRNQLSHAKIENVLNVSMSSFLLII